MTSAGDPAAADPGQVLRFWFGELRDGLADGRHRKRWFTPTAAVDAEIRERFGRLWASAAEGALDHWRQTPQSALALVLVCDQFPRQIHRGSANAYATDPLALEVARDVVERGDDLDLAFDEQAFLYMPFEHSESRVDQHTSVGLFSALRDSIPPRGRRHAGGYLAYARQHRDIVLRFGRFPHRNHALGRPSTEAELAFLETASTYGQTVSRRPRER